MNQRIFKENATYHDIKETMIKELSTKTVASEAELKLGLQSFQRLSHNQRFLMIVSLIDHSCPKFQKVDTILSASIFIDQYQKKTENLTDEELVTLTCFASVGERKYQRECFELYDQVVLGEICRKTKDMRKRLNYLELLEEEFENKDKDKDKMRVFLHNKSIEELDQLEKQRDINKIFDDVATKGKLSL